MRLDSFDNSDFDRGASRPKEFCWILCQGLFFGSWIPGSGWRRVVLRLFGATVGQSVVVKPRVNVKFPWRLSIGANAWIGEKVWIDNLAHVHISGHVCISQGVYVCTGNHDWSDPTFKLLTREIFIEEGAWIGAQSTICPGCVIESKAVLPVGTVATGTYSSGFVHLPCGGKKLRYR